MLIWENFGSQSFLGGSVSITELPLAKWFVVNANLAMLNVNNNTEGFTSNSFFGNGYLNAAFILPKDYKIEVTGFIQTGIPYGYFKIEPMGDLTLGVKKGIFQNKGTIALNIMDIFNTRTNKASLNSNALEGYNFTSHYNSRQITLSFQYRFGQGKAMKARKVGNNEEASRAGSGN